MMQWKKNLNCHQLKIFISKNIFDKINIILEICGNMKLRVVKIIVETERDRER